MPLILKLQRLVNRKEFDDILQKLSLTPERPPDVPKKYASTSEDNDSHEMVRTLFLL